MMQTRAFAVLGGALVVALASFVLFAGSTSLMSRSDVWQSFAHSSGDDSSAAPAHASRDVRGRRADHGAAFDAHLRALDEALARRDVSAAVHGWYDAYGAALATRSWEPMIRVGDAFIRIGEVAGTPKAARPNARNAYLMAFTRAQASRSAEGVFAASQAFARLGDEEVARVGLRLAARLATDQGDTGLLARVRAFPMPKPETIGVQEASR